MILKHYTHSQYMNKPIVTVPSVINQYPIFSITFHTINTVQENKLTLGIAISVTAFIGFKWTLSLTTSNKLFLQHLLGLYPSKSISPLSPLPPQLVHQTKHKHHHQAPIKETRPLIPGYSTTTVGNITIHELILNNITLRKTLQGNTPSPLI